MKMDAHYDFNRYADSLKANVEACERIIGRKLTNQEANQLAMLVGRIQGHIQRAESHFGT
jgi:hypothetical protein